MNAPAAVELEIPPRQAATATSFDWRRRAVRAWLQDLPVANLGETSRQVFEAIEAVNRIDIPAADRFGFLRQVTAVVIYIAEGLRKHYIGRELPLHPKPRKIAELTVVLLQETALGYEICVEDMRAGRSRRRLATVVGVALHLRARVLLEHWLIYQPPPAGTWGRLHHLYDIAEQGGVTDTRRALRGATRDDRAHPDTPAGIYKQPVLTAAAGPARMSAAEILDTWRLFAQWANSAALPEPESGFAEVSAYRIPRSADEPPHASVATLDRPDDRLVQTSALVRLIDRELSSAGRPSGLWRRKPRSAISPQLANRLLLALGAVPVRRHPRMRARARVQVAVGLTRLHRLLTHELGLRDDAAADADAPFRTRFVRRDGEDAPDIWDLIYPSELLRIAAAQEVPAGTTTEAAPEPLPDWDLVNIGRGGYCLLADPTEATRAQVGDLVMLREIAGRGLAWQLGSIRWMRAAPGEGLQMGVEILAPAPVPVRLRAHRGDGRFGPAERGLLLPAVEAAEQPPTLVAPGPQYRTGQEARLRQGNREVPLILGREHDATPQYVQMEFRTGNPLANDPVIPATCE